MAVPRRSPKLNIALYSDEEYSRENFYGMEFDWPCLDSKGNLAIIVSFGNGHIPPSVFKQASNWNTFWQCVAELPTSNYSIRTTMDEEFAKYAERGFYVYDRNCHCCTEQEYTLVMSPDIPLCIGELTDVDIEWLPSLPIVFGNDALSDSFIREQTKLENKMVDSNQI